VLWLGAAERRVDLHALVPPPFNASVAWATEVGEGVLRICGEANRYEVADAGTDRESHFLPEARAVLWTARLR
jgi:hypothetical protein